jgi:glycosyltransferase involved in cell wall biosynthesis
MRTILNDSELAASMGKAAVERAQAYTWRAAAERLRDLYAELGVESLVTCHGIGEEPT